MGSASGRPWVVRGRAEARVYVPLLRTVSLGWPPRPALPLLVARDGRTGQHWQRARLVRLVAPRLLLGRADVPVREARPLLAHALRPALRVSALALVRAVARLDSRRRCRWSSSPATMTEEVARGRSDWWVRGAGSCGVLCACHSGDWLRYSPMRGWWVFERNSRPLCT